MTNYGNWKYDPKYMTLTYTPYDYEVNLEQCTDSAEILDWIFQIKSKHWGPIAIDDFLTAIAELLDPQANYCSFGISKTAVPKEILPRPRSRIV